MKNYAYEISVGGYVIAEPDEMLERRFIDHRSGFHFDAKDIWAPTETRAYDASATALSIF